MQNEEKAKKIIEENIYCTIATASTDGTPWISPVFFAFDDSYNIYWVSNKDALHSRLIRKNQRTAIVIFDTHAPEGAGTAVYIKAHASELEKEDEVKPGIKLFNKRAADDEFKIKGLEQVTEDGVWRIYKAIRQETSLLGDGEYIKGQYVDKRIEIEL